jgi:hypothetical protein
VRLQHQLPAVCALPQADVIELLMHHQWSITDPGGGKHFSRRWQAVTSILRVTGGKVDRFSAHSPTSRPLILERTVSDRAGAIKEGPVESVPRLVLVMTSMRATQGRVGDPVAHEQGAVDPPDSLANMFWRGNARCCRTESSLTC